MKSQAFCKQRICDYCHRSMTSGMTNEGNGFDAAFRCHEECFEEAMNSRYGQGMWRLNPDYAADCSTEGEYGGYYDALCESGAWEDTGIYYTEWED